MLGWQVGPQLKTVHATAVVALRHFLMQDSAPSSHPLNITRPKGSLVAKAVAVFDFAGKNVSNRFDAAMGMPRETILVLPRVVVAEICLLYTSPSPRDATLSRMPSSA